jgi:hypothetical protein
MYQHIFAMLHLFARYLEELLFIGNSLDEMTTATIISLSASQTMNILKKE